MTDSKYGRYVVRKPLSRGDWDGFDFVGEEDYNSDISFIFLKVEKPCVMEDSPHTHDFDMYLHFLSFDPEDMEHLDADIEIGFGAERELHHIDSPCSVFIPKGMVHCPLIFKRVDKPLFFVHTSIAPKYVKKEEAE